jgi:hypothetical protein
MFGIGHVLQYGTGSPKTPERAVWPAVSLLNLNSGYSLFCCISRVLADQGFEGHPQATSERKGNSIQLRLISAKYLHLSRSCSSKYVGCPAIARSLLMDTIRTMD